MFTININTEYGTYYLKDSMNSEEDNAVDLIYMDGEEEIVECINIFGMPFFEEVNNVTLIIGHYDMEENYAFHKTVVLHTESKSVKLMDWHDRIYANIPVKNKDVTVNFYSPDQETCNPMIIVIGN